MSTDILGGIDYARMKRHYDADDSTAVTFGVPGMSPTDYYVVGLNAAIADPTVINVWKGWTAFTHGQANYPTWTIITATALGITLPPLSPVFPAFEAKEIRIYCTAPMLVSFDSPIRVQHLIPPLVQFAYRRRTFMIFFQPQPPGAAGTINMSFFG